MLLPSNVVNPILKSNTFQKATTLNVPITTTLKYVCKHGKHIKIIML